MTNPKRMLSTIYNTLHAADLVELEYIYTTWAKKYEDDEINLAGDVGHLLTSALLFRSL